MSYGPGLWGDSPCRRETAVWGEKSQSFLDPDLPVEMARCFVGALNQVSAAGFPSVTFNGAPGVRIQAVLQLVIIFARAIGSCTFLFVRARGRGPSSLDLNFTSRFRG